MSYLSSDISYLLLALILFLFFDLAKLSSLVILERGLALERLCLYSLNSCSLK